MTDQFPGTTKMVPITPPLELVRQWRSKWMASNCDRDSYQNIATQAARWGADQELEACCEWVEREIEHGREWGAELRAARRPKPPSLKDQALKALRCIERGIDSPGDTDTIRRALEALDD